MMKKRLILVWMLVILSSIALAEPLLTEPLLIVVVNSPDSPSSIIDVAVLETNSFDDTRLYEDQSPDSSTIEVVAEGLGGNVLSRKFLEGYSTQMAFVQGTSRVKVVSGSIVFAERQVSFCDDDRVCEPCSGALCSLIENSLTCSDCCSGSKDGFCDTVSDGICDPDCDFDPVDADCERQCSEDCGLEDTSLLSCDDFGGSVCEPHESCMTGWMVYAEDSMYCCVGGVCAYPNEYVQTMITMQDQPSMVITPSGEFASTLQEEGMVGYCEDELKGVLCDSYERCDGRLVEIYYHQYCCVGRCVVPLPGEMPSDEFIAEVLNETERPMSGEEMSALYNFSSMGQKLAAEQEDFYPEEIVEDIPDGEFPHESIAEAGSPTPVVSAETFVRAMDTTNRVLAKVSLFHVVAIVLGIVLVILVLMFLFTRSASRKLVAEGDAVAPSRQEGLQSGLQSEIGSLVSQGNGYKQVEQLLLQKGFDKAAVDAEIRKDYQRRLEIQRLRK